ncbi:helix-turn-helix transcriptional regulator [Egibacter rhizosphaerae]|uniref:helix-turn-helix transcriptional regulator n=1 Tax=Egibacter rhizosphaerae TaxID=1670831 RepID=UPI0013F15F4E|nr:helix-turn-helix transcriptional regulator [Egibacter rhizosphaerae]
MAAGRFVGRDEELVRLRDAWRRAGEERPCTVLIGGEAGIGKSRLVGEFVQGLDPVRARVLTSACVSLGTGGLSYAPVVEALRPLAVAFSGPALDWLVGEGGHELEPLLPELTGRSESERVEAPPVEAAAQHRLFLRLLQLLERLSTDRPVVLVIEDLHWADHSTRELLAFLARNLRDVPVLLVGTYRTEHLQPGDPLRALLLELDHGRVGERLELARFDRERVAELVERLVGVPVADEVTGEVLRRSDGNPLFAEELLECMRRGDERALPPTLRDLLSDRVERLDPAGRAVVEAAAVVGHDVDHRLLAAVAGLDEEALAVGVREAATHQILESMPDGRTYRFRHALIAEVVQAELTVAERQRLHGAIAEAVSARPGPIGSDTDGVVAHHWDAAGIAERALPARLAAGFTAERTYGFGEAHRHFARAAELWEEAGDPPSCAGVDRVDVLERAATAADFSGEHASATRLATDALEHADPQRTGRLRQIVGRSRLLAGDSSTGVEEAGTAVEQLPDTAPSRLRAELLATYGLMLAVTGRSPDRADACCQEARELASGLGLPDVEARARNGLALLGGSDVHGAIEHLHAARALADAAGNVEELLRTELNLAFVLASAGRIADAARVTGDGAARAREFGAGRWQGVLLETGRASACFALGRWDEAEEVLARVLRNVPTGRAARIAGALCADLETARGRFDRAERALGACRQGDLDEEDVAAAAAELALWRGCPDDAIGTVGPALERADEPTTGLGSGAARLRWLAIRAHTDRIAIAAPLRRERVVAEGRRSVAALAEDAARDEGGLPPQRAYAALSVAETSRARQEPAPEQWEIAARRWEALPHLHHAAYARWRQAEALAAGQAPEGAIGQPLRQALASAGELGAEPLREAVEALALRARIAVDVDREDGGQDPETPDPAAELGLTHREVDVLELLAEGWTNPRIGRALYITDKTASVHVTNILRKLGCRNRTEAAAVAHRLGLATPSDPATRADSATPTD